MQEAGQGEGNGFAVVRVGRVAAEEDGERRPLGPSETLLVGAHRARAFCFPSLFFYRFGRPVKVNKTRVARAERAAQLTQKKPRKIGEAP